MVLLEATITITITTAIKVSITMEMTISTTINTTVTIHDTLIIDYSPPLHFSSSHIEFIFSREYLHPKQNVCHITMFYECQFFNAPHSVVKCMMC